MTEGRPSDRDRGRLSRRRLLARTAAGAAALSQAVLAACRVSGSPAHPSTSSPSRSSAAQPKTGGTFKTFIPVNLTSLDAHATKSIQARTVAGAVMSRLFLHKTAADPAIALRLDIDNDLATSAESADGVTWTVKLRSDAAFPDVGPFSGHPVEAEDIRVSYQRGIALPDSAARTYMLMIDPNQIETPAKDTIVFKLKTPYGPFLQTMAGTVAGWIYPREVQTGRYDPAKQVIGSGPFLFDSYTPDVAAACKRSASWFQRGRPYVDAIQTSIIPNPAQQLAQFTAGNLDELFTDANNLDAAKRDNPKASVLAAPWPNSYQIFGHLDDPSSPFGDIRLRQAISMAIDRAAIGKAVFNGDYHDNGVLSSSKQPWALQPQQLGDASKYYSFNLPEAKRLVAAAGSSAQFRKFVYPTQAYGPQFETIAQMLNSMLNAAGIKTELVGVDYPTQFINVGKGILYGHYEPDTLVFAIWYGGTQSSEEALLNALAPGYDSNHSKVDDPVLTDMVMKMIANPDAAQRLKAGQDIQRYAAEKIYYISSIPTGNTFTLVQPRVQDYAYSLNVDVEGTETTAKLWLAG